MLLLVSLIIIECLVYKYRTKKFVEIFNCDKSNAEIFCSYYFKKIKFIKRNSKTINKDIKEVNKEIKKYLINTQNKSDESK